MVIPLLTTKLLAPPLRHKLVVRQKLIKRLNQGSESGLVLISAPAGYGKTTLLSTWLSQVPYENVWLSLDDADNDPVRFLTYLAAALRIVVPPVGDVFEILLRISPMPAVESFLNPIVNLFIQIERPFWLILDDYHLIQNQVAHQIVRFLIENRPPQFHLAIATRTDPPFPLSKYRARSQMVELRLADLRFDTQEIAEFMGTVMSLNLSPIDLSLLERTTEGWIAGLQIAGLSLQGREDTSAFIKSFSGDNRYILDFLFDEVFHQQSQDIQNFLLQSSILERLCASLCNVVTQQENSQAILSTLERNNLFLIPLDEQRKWYRYHHLFGELLRSHLKQSFPGDCVVAHQRASAWYEAENDPENAIIHALAAHEFERAADLIERIAKILDMQNQQAKLSAWLDKLPLEILKERPWLCLYRAWSCYWMGRREEEEAWLQAAEKSIRINTDIHDPKRQHLLGRIATIRAHTALVAENIPQALEMGQKALELLPDSDTMLSEAAMALAGAYWALGDIVQTKRAFGMARSAALKINYTSMAAGASGFIGLQQIKQGNLETAITTYLDALHLATLPDGSETPIAGFLNVRLGDVWREQNKLDIASKYLVRGVEQCLYLGQPDLLTDAYVCLGRYMLAIGDLKAANDVLEKADDVARHKKVDHWVLCWLDDCRLRIWLAENNLEAAVLWTQSSDLSPDGDLSYHHDLHHQNLARFLVAQGHLSGLRTTSEKATNLLARLQIAAENAGWVHEEIKILLMQAINYWVQKADEAALISLARAVSLAESGGYLRVFVDEGSILRDLLVILDKRLQKDWPDGQNLLEISFHGEKSQALQIYIRRLISAFDDNLAKPKILVTNRYVRKPVDSLSAREMEVLKLLAQGFSNKKIAENLVIANGTVHKHLKNIYGKLDVHNRTSAISRARELGLL